MATTLNGIVKIDMLRVCRQIKQASKTCKYVCVIGPGSSQCSPDEIYLFFRTKRLLCQRLVQAVLRGILNTALTFGVSVVGSLYNEDSMLGSF